MNVFYKRLPTHVSFSETYRIMNDSLQFQILQSVKMIFLNDER